MHYLGTFIISMIPLLELRASIIYAAGNHIPWLPAYVISVLGSFLPVPFIMLFIRKILAWMKTIPKLSKIALFVENKAAKGSLKVKKFETLGLFLFVAIPLPGTGAWTGSLIAAMMDMRYKYAFVSIFCGILVAGFIMSGVSYGFLKFLSFMV